MAKGDWPKAYVIPSLALSGTAAGFLIWHVLDPAAKVDGWAITLLVVAFLPTHQPSLPTTTEASAPVPPPPVQAGEAGTYQVTYSVTGTQDPGDIITVTFSDESGRSSTQRNVVLPWSFTVTPIAQSEVPSVQASSLFLVSKLNCSITNSDGALLSSNTSNSSQISC